MELDFDTVFKPTTFASKLNGSHPNIEKDLKWALQFLICHGLFSITFISMAYNVFLGIQNNDFSAICRNGCFVVAFCDNTFQYSVLVVFQNKMIRLIADMKKDFKECRNSPEDLEIVTRFAKQGRWVCQQWLVVTFLGCSLFPFKNFALYFYHYYKQHDFELIPLFEMTYPTIIEEKKNNIIVYIVIYLILLYFSIYCAIMYTAFVPYGPMFMLHACGQLELIKRKIERLLAEYPLKDEDIDGKLVNIIEHLQYVYSFVEDINDSFRVIYEIGLKAASIILPVTVYEVMEVYHQGQVSFEFITIAVGSLMITYGPCSTSDMIMEKGEEVRQAIYACGWERHYDPIARRVRITLLILLSRAVRPIAISTIFRTLCLDTLTDVYHQSYAVFSLMNAMWK